MSQDRIFKRAARWVRTHKYKADPLDAHNLQAKSRLVTPGDVDPDGAKPVEEGGVRTDAPYSSTTGLTYPL